MYGLVNKAIGELVCEHFGVEKWHAVKIRSGIDIDFFLALEPYDDEITYTLANAVSEEMNMPIEQVMVAFGEYWVLKTGKEKYGALMSSGGADLKSFLLNLPVFHDRVALFYPKLIPPVFKVSDVTDQSLHLHYITTRPGLQDFVIGLIQGLGKFYSTEVKIELLQTRKEGSDHEIYKIIW